MRSDFNSRRCCLKYLGSDLFRPSVVCQYATSGDSELLIPRSQPIKMITGQYIAHVEHSAAEPDMMENNHEVQMKCGGRLRMGSSVGPSPGIILGDFCTGKE